MKTMLRFAFVFLLLFAAFNQAPAMAQFFFFDNPMVGKPAPDFTLNKLGPDGEKMVSLSGFRDGKPAIIFFWATWCPHCRVQLKTLKDKKQEFAAKGIKVAFVDLGEKEPTVRAFLKKAGIDADVFLDEESTVGDTYGVIGIPTFVFINAGGVVKSVENEFPADFEKILLTKDGKK